MPKVTIRPQRVSDAKRFFEILCSPHFKYFSTKAKSIEDERKWLAKNPERAKKNIEHNFAVLYDGYLVGGIGVKIDQHRKHIGEIGYFIDHEYWGRGIATAAVKQLEKMCFGRLGLKRVTIIMHPKNRGSERVAIKAGYGKEGKMRNAVEQKGKYLDANLYAKIKK
jgi:ribosomal-protein-alanine N-acetyltransferase